ncbi:MAG: dockerin type I repeat-containing protein [candidate division Zixibacteria bacterium]|nr:dockerin type I repeat-containing protein [candidate division Zixibacteria bacterium]
MGTSRVYFCLLISVLLLSSISIAQDPGVADTVRIGNTSGTVYDVLSVPVSLFNDEELNVVMIPLHIDGYSGWMMFDSVTFTGGRLEDVNVLFERESYMFDTDSITYELLVLRFSQSSGIVLPAGDGKLCDLWFSPKFGGEALIDSASWSPYGTLTLSDASTSNEFVPEFQSGAVDVACDYTIGDVNGDGSRNMADFISFGKNYLYCSGVNLIYGEIPYRDDMNGDRCVDVRDAYYLFKESFQGGPHPECGVYNAPIYNDPGVRDTLYIESDTLYEGIPATIAISYTNDQPTHVTDLHVEWAGDVNIVFEESSLYEETERTEDGCITIADCVILPGTSGSFWITSPLPTNAPSVPSGSGPIIYLLFTPQNTGTSTLQFVNSSCGAESLFMTEDDEVILPVIVGGDIIVLPRPCGDANKDGLVNVGDVVYIVNFAFRGGPEPEPLCFADANGDGEANVGDAVYIINYVFKGGPAPVTNCCP